MDMRQQVEGGDWEAEFPTAPSSFRSLIGGNESQIQPALCVPRLCAFHATSLISSPQRKASAPPFYKTEANEPNGLPKAIFSFISKYTSTYYVPDL
jgi:hypothetical protein